MRRVFHALFTVTSAASLLLCVAVCVLWVRSYWLEEEWRGRSTTWSNDGQHEVQRDARAVSSYGGLWLWYRVGGTSYGGDDIKPSLKPATWSYEVEPATQAWVVAPIRATGNPDLTWVGRTLIDRFGFGLQRSVFTYSSYPPSRSNLTVVLLPMWSLASAFLMSPVGWVWSQRRKRAQERRRRERRCVACGYDLRASPERCPECGAVPQVSR